MFKILNQGKQKKSITYLIFLGRLLLLILCIALASAGKLSDDQFRRILFAVLPATIIYLVFIIKYLIAGKRYYYPGEIVNTGYFFLSCLPLVLLHLLEIAFILFRKFFFDNIDFLYLMITLFECALAGYAGAYLSTLFAKKNN